MVFTLLSSSVMAPSQPGSTKPAVLWMSRPRRPRLDLPSTLETRSSARRTRSRVDPRTNSPGWRMKRSPVATSTSSVMSSSGFARSMKACLLERNTRKKRSSRMSTDAGCTQLGSNGSRPMRPDEMAARMSRSDRTTTAKYGVARAGEREHDAPQLGPRAHEAFRAGQTRLRETPRDLHAARAGRPRHVDVRACIADDDAFGGRDRKTLGREQHEIRRGLVAGH